MNGLNMIIMQVPEDDFYDSAHTKVSKSHDTGFIATITCHYTCAQILSVVRNL